jgi:GNAT superfamily N-acetyltransferase
MDETIYYRPLEPADREQVAQAIVQFWGEDRMITRGKSFFPSQLPGFAAFQEGEMVGLATYAIQGQECELVTLNSLVPGRGIGRTLIDLVRGQAEQAGCQRLWLITTNDNTRALRFYQVYGFRLVALHPGAIEQSRQLKPGIPLTGLDGIPIRDEIELELRLDEKP